MEFLSYLPEQRFAVGHLACEVAVGRVGRSLHVLGLKGFAVAGHGFGDCESFEVFYQEGGISVVVDGFKVSFLS